MGWRYNIWFTVIYFCGFSWIRNKKFNMIIEEIGNSAGAEIQVFNT